MTPNKHAPLNLGTPEERAAFLEWALSEDDGNISAGYVPMPSKAADKPEKPAKE